MKRKPSKPVVDSQFVQVDFNPSFHKNTNKNQDFKQFMSTKISNLSLKKNRQVNQKDQDDEDLELDSLLKSSKILDEIRVEELTGKEKRQYLDDNLEKFGGKVYNSNPQVRITYLMSRKSNKKCRFQCIWE